MSCLPNFHQQSFHSLKRPGKSRVLQLGVVPRKNAYFSLCNFQELCSRSPFRHTSRDNIARVQSQRTGQT